METGQTFVWNVRRDDAWEQIARYSRVVPDRLLRQCAPPRPSDT